MNILQDNLRKIRNKIQYKDFSIKALFVHNLWLKIISLVIAIVTWLYVNGELSSGVSV
jgi:hypothetical protein